MYGEVRRASREAIIAPHSLYTLMCVVSCGALVDSTKYSTKLDEVQLTVDDVVKLVERKRLENAILRAAGNFTTSSLYKNSCGFACEEFPQEIQT